MSLSLSELFDSHFANPAVIQQCTSTYYEDDQDPVLRLADPRYFIHLGIDYRALELYKGAWKGQVKVHIYLMTRMSSTRSLCSTINQGVNCALNSAMLSIVMRLDICLDSHCVDELNNSSKHCKLIIDMTW